MASSAIASPHTPLIKKKDAGLSSFSSPASCSIKSSEKKFSKKIVSLMAPQQSERKPSSVKTGMTITEKILAKASEKSHLSFGENVWVNVVLILLMFATLVFLAFSRKSLGKMQLYMSTT